LDLESGGKSLAKRKQKKCVTLPKWPCLESSCQLDGFFALAVGLSCDSQLAGTALSLTLCPIKKKSQPHKQHIWFFADTKANAEKTKRAVFCQRSKKKRTEYGKP
jgi:hypothetical protein